MSATGLLAAGAVLLAFAAARELAGMAGEDAGSRIRAAVSAVSSQRTLVGAKLGCAACGALVGAVAVPALPARLAPPAFATLTVAGFMAPDAWRERRARRRRRRLVAALPDALDLLAVGSASGRGIGVLLGEIAAATTGPLADELRVTAAEIEAGAPAREAIAELRGRAPGAEVGGLATAIDRSRLYGSPLADQLHLQAAGLRRDARRRMQERAARAAPKIQLVVALVLVPSVLLVIVAGLVANSDALFGAL